MTLKRLFLKLTHRPHLTKKRRFNLYIVTTFLLSCLLSGCLRSAVHLPEARSAIGMHAEVAHSSIDVLTDGGGFVRYSSKLTPESFDSIFSEVGITAGAIRFLERNSNTTVDRYILPYLIFHGKRTLEAGNFRTAIAADLASSMSARVSVSLSYALGPIQPFAAAGVSIVVPVEGATFWTDGIAIDWGQRWRCIGTFSRYQPDDLVVLKESVLGIGVEYER